MRDMLEPVAVMPTPHGQRECSQCPPWVKACVHWEGQILSLVDQESPTPSGLCDVHGAADSSGFAVCLGIQRGHCECGLAYTLSLEDHACPDLPAAEAEFRKRELAMLGREAE